MKFLVLTLFACACVSTVNAQEMTMLPPEFTSTNWNWHASFAPRQPIEVPPAWGWGRGREYLPPIVTPIDDVFGIKAPLTPDPIAPIRRPISTLPVEPPTPDADVATDGVGLTQFIEPTTEADPTLWTWEGYVE